MATNATSPPATKPDQARKTPPPQSPQAQQQAPGVSHPRSGSGCCEPPAVQLALGSTVLRYGRVPVKPKGLTPFISQQQSNALSPHPLMLACCTPLLAFPVKGT